MNSTLKAPCAYCHKDDCTKHTLGRSFCRRCADAGTYVEAAERYSMGVYAGTYCDDCWERDGRNHNHTFDPLDAGEHYDEGDY